MPPCFQGGISLPFTARSFYHKKVHFVRFFSTVLKKSAFFLINRALRPFYPSIFRHICAIFRCTMFTPQRKGCVSMADNNRPYNLANIGEIIGNRISKLTQKTKEALPSHSASAESTVSAAFLKSAALYLLKKSALVLISYLFGSASALFTTYPFGLALLCASSKDILFIYLGLLFAAHSIKGEATAFFLIYTACVIMRFAFSKWIADDGSKKSTANDTVYVSKMFNEPFALRMLTVIICKAYFGRFFIL